jgi:hypothetical protein
MPEYAFDVILSAAIRVTADSQDAAIAILKDKIDCADANLGSFDNGDPILCEVSLHTPPTPTDCYEIDGDEPCALCGDGNPDGGDGWDGLCPPCADRVSEYMDDHDVDRDAAVEALTPEE